MNIDHRKDFTDEELAYLDSLPIEELERHLAICQDESILCNTNQLSRKVLINSLYGA